MARPGTHVDVDERHIPALQSQQYAQAGLVDAGPEKQFIRDQKKQGRWCRKCNFLGHSWMKSCSKCGGDTVTEDELELSYTMDDLFPEYAHMK